MHASIVTIQVNPAHLREYLDGVLEYALVVEAEPGCLRYDLLQDLADPNRIHVYEVFMDDAAFEAHRRSDHNLEWREKAKGWHAPESVSRRCVTVYPPNSVWEKGMA